ncbi:MAG: ADOP family duplicated permease, partial [Thermoanaerobaculia bacterium]|nr:ADOP family duplicated permease [Thermoanaerobaculia bacterium]
MSFGANLAFEGQVSDAQGQLVSGSYFPTLGLVPALGRLLDESDDRVIGEARVAVLSHDYWQSRFGSDPAILDRVLVVNGEPLTIVGVAPEGFRGTTVGVLPRVYVPITLRGVLQHGFDGFEDRRSYWAYLFGRLRPGVSLEEAKTALDVRYGAIIRDVEAPLQEGMSAQTLERFKAKELTVEPGPRGQSSFHREASTPVYLLFTVAGIVLLIACANVANLMLARGASRSGEMALRLSIGAGRSRLVSQLLAEACLLALVAGAVSLVVADATLKGMAALLPASIARPFEFHLQPSVVAFAAVLALGTGVLFGLFPALHNTRVDLSSALKGQSGRGGTGRAASRFRTTLVVAQIALSTTLLVSAGLFLRSLDRVSRVDLGLDADNVVTFSVSPQRNGYSDEHTRRLLERTEQELAALPGVTGVTSALVPVVGGSSWGRGVRVQGFATDPDTDVDSRFNAVGPGYFRTLGVPLLAGREFTEHDTDEAPRVAIVNETFAEKFGLGRDAVGMRMDNANAEELGMEIVGLVGNAKYSSVKDRVPPVFFVPYRQQQQLPFASFYVRTRLAPEASLQAVAAAMAELDPNLPVEGLKTLPQQVSENVFLDRFLSVLSAAFASLATLLAAVGLYGVLAYTVAQRTREIGLRMALGADRVRVRRMVFRQVGLMTLAGGAVGVVAAIGLGTLAGSLLYEVEGHDPLVLAGSLLLLAAIAVASGLVPAVRGSAVSYALDRAGRAVRAESGRDAARGGASSWARVGWVR